MNERYLFRGKRVDNGEWIVGNLIQNMIFQDIYSITTHSNIHNRKIKVAHDTVGQCTGLCDGDDTLIFAGDILSDGITNGIVEWRDGGWCLDYGEDNDNLIDVHAGNRISGNIYDNTELLGEVTAHD